jgi:hypothetical protein
LSAGSIDIVSFLSAEGGDDTMTLDDEKESLLHFARGARPLETGNGVVGNKVYARADAWYIQPTPFSMQPIEANNTWETWTHTGSSYAALVVRKTYKPMTRLDVLPQIDADVLSRTIVDGRK